MDSTSKNPSVHSPAIAPSYKLANIHGFGFGEHLGEPTFSDAIFLRTTDNQLVPWTVSQSDALATDWVIL